MGWFDEIIADDQYGIGVVIGYECGVMTDQAFVVYEEDKARSIPNTKRPNPVKNNLQKAVRLESMKSTKMAGLNTIKTDQC